MCCRADTKLPFLPFISVILLGSNAIYVKNMAIFVISDSKLKRTPLDLRETIFGKFHQNRLSSFLKRLWTDTHTQTHRHTHTQTDTQTTPVFFPETITLHLVNEMTQCKTPLCLL